MENNDRMLNYDDFIENDDEFVLLPDGDYSFMVTDIERKEYAGNGKKIPQGCRMVTVELLVNNSVRIKETFFLLESLAWKISQFYRALGMKKKGERAQMKWNDVVGKTGKVQVYIDTFTGNDGNERKTNRVKRFLAAEETAPAPKYSAGVF